jgi:hypothetical protein
MPFGALTPEIACDMLADAGLQFTPDQVGVEKREERYVVHLPGRRLAWFAASDEGSRRLRTERRVLRLLEERCTFGAPRVLVEDEAGRFDVRSMVPGMTDPWGAYAEVLHNVEFAGRLGAAIGAVLAQQHSRIGAADAEGWLPRTPACPESRYWVARGWSGRPMTRNCSSMPRPS